MKRSVEMARQGVPVAPPGAPRCRHARFSIKRHRRLVRRILVRAKVAGKEMPLEVADDMARGLL